ncbi:uncharacterized protein A4U43_C08F19120 [Asparagus officinalis]|uniref:uncharacterized protein LOC109820154 n=1 Tax=Asparagus officinalis TaxID=4686 RepID=UPI00098E5DEC|nr:uncharacterized protein LOC109820154 [Asparagus officinalis]ONK60497.1 uncharacterized protein A4U43_C08F19120 [Asparagus officinalis]
MRMDWSKYVFIFVVISPLLPPRAVGDLYTPLSPMLSPLLNGVCNVVDCGKGKCQASSNHTFGFACQCNPGWTQFHVGDSFRFLPCVVPNCSINYSCTNNSVAPAPAPVPPPPDNLSIFDPCMWSYCGGGKCLNTATYEHKCECDEGYSNLFNTSTFPCYKDCSLGADCANLGINVSNLTKSASPSSLPADNSTSAARDLSSPNNSILLSIFFISLALARLI